MTARFDYTTRAREIAYKYPRFNYIGTQVNFWMIAFVLLSTINHLNTDFLRQISPEIYEFPYSIVLITSLTMGIIFGIITGTIDLLIDRSRFRRLSVGMIILIKAVTYPLILAGITAFSRFLFTGVISSYIGVEMVKMFDNHHSWGYIYISILIYTSFMGAVISFINLMNSKFGPGILVPLLLGKYRTPKEQERFFMFIDMKSSATHAEALGHLQFSSLIRDCFQDMNSVLTKNNAEIYQYVGDEVVVTWPMAEGTRNHYCFSLFFDFNDRLKDRENYYTKKYNIIPQFKAGLHCGLITTVEVGVIRREIAYHGDTINTAARIQGLCNQYNSSLLVSESVVSVMKTLGDTFNVKSLGKVALKGKGDTVELFDIKRLCE